MTIPILIILLAGSFLLYLATLSPDRFGSYHDDGIYVVTAKALATGRGYGIISLPFEPSQTKFPPFYPFLLSIIWRIHPQFPANLFPMMLLSALGTTAFLALAWHYLVKKSYATGVQAVLVVVLVGINWRTVVLATSIYSEMIYSALSVGALWLAEAYEKERRSRIKGIVLGGMMGIVFLTRTSGIALLIATVIYFLFRKQFGKASLLLAVGGSFVLAWLGWCYASTTSVGNINAAFYTSYFADFLENVNDFQTLLKIIATNAFMLLFVSGPLTVLGLGYVQAEHFLVGMLIVISLTFIFITRGFLKHISEGFRLLHFYVLSYLTLHLFWPYTSYDRFLIPILPFLLLFLITELEFLIVSVRRSLKLTGQIAQKISAGFLALVIVALSSVAFYHHSFAVHRSLASKEIYAGRASEDKKAIQWINSYTDPSDVLLCDRDPLYYLYTGRKAIRPILIKPSVSISGTPSIHDRAKIIFGIINESAARYLILTSHDFEYEKQPDIMRKQIKILVGQYPQVFVPVFESAEGRTTIYNIKVSVPTSTSELRRGRITFSENQDAPLASD